MIQIHAHHAMLNVEEMDVVVESMELIRCFLHEEFVARWDYARENPRQDMRGRWTSWAGWQCQLHLQLTPQQYRELHRHSSGGSGSAVDSAIPGARKRGSASHIRSTCEA